MKKKGKRGYIINAEGKREYVKKSEYIDLDSFKKGMDFSFTIKLMVIAPLVFFILNFIVLDILYSDVLKESVFVPKNIPYLIVTVFMILWTIYLAINFHEKPTRIYLFSGVFCLLESIFFLIIGVQMLYFLLEKEALVYILVGIGVYLFTLIFNAFIAYLFTKKGYSEENEKITRIRIFSIVFIFAIGLIFSINLKLNFHEKIAQLYPNMGETSVLEYANSCIVLSQLIGIGTINIYKYIHMKK
ncbi:hypothetical protein [Clostridium perfringens]|nr:hypothetical protein [Clostridium perfringens]MDU1016249.1 hypothetical protein [Clostridium perfringens]MDU2748030.1 hypothetical protein [Clostridium perfringens]MDU2866936.1 hypothetical protein [Clostridium perfringens]MDU3597978.1 hypothetical protein [Clostridium perfringens]MDU7583836.1 hypothetical protein [Clostridium perfringens]